MDAYYVNLARGCLSDSAKRLRDAQQFMAQAGDLKAELDKVRRLISGIENRNKVLGDYIVDSYLIEY